MSNPLGSALDDAFCGERVRVVANDGTVYEGHCQKIHHHDRHVVLRGAERHPDEEDAPREDVGPVFAAHCQSIERVRAEHVMEAALPTIEPAPWAVREFDSQENAAFVGRVHGDRWVRSFPTVRRVLSEAAHTYEICNGHKRLWAAAQAVLDFHPVRVIEGDPRDGLDHFVDHHYPPQALVEADDQGRGDWYTDAEIRASLQVVADSEHWDWAVTVLERVRYHADRLGVEPAPEAVADGGEVDG